MKKDFESSWYNQVKQVKDRLPSDELELNVRGVYFPTVSRSLLTSLPGSALEAFFSGRHEVTQIKGKIYVDRDPESFKSLLRYLENGQKLITFDWEYQNQ